MATALGIAIRLFYAYLRQRHALGYDSEFYTGDARAIASGQGLVSGVEMRAMTPVVMQTGVHPPLTALWLSLAYLFGLDSPLGLRIWSSVPGMLTVPVIALTAGRLGGKRAGQVGGLLAALCPGLWGYGPLANSESLSQLTIAAVVLAGVSFAQSPSVNRAAWAGGTIGVATLVRGECILLLVFLLVPLLRDCERRKLSLMIAQVVAAAAWFAVLVAPYIVWNVQRFEEPVFLASGFDLSIGFGNCSLTHSPTRLPNGQVDYAVYGYFYVGCVPNVARTDGQGRFLDESEIAAQFRASGIEYIEQHPGQVVRSVPIRVARTFGLWRPSTVVRAEALFEARSEIMLWSSLIAFWIFTPLALVGVVVVRRSGLGWPVFRGILWLALVVSALSWGTARFRLMVDVSWVTLAAVGVSTIEVRVRDGGGPVPVISARWRERRGWRSSGIRRSVGVGR